MLHRLALPRGAWVLLCEPLVDCGAEDATLLRFDSALSPGLREPDAVPTLRTLYRLSRANLSPLPLDHENVWAYTPQKAPRVREVPN